MQNLFKIKSQWAISGMPRHLWRFLLYLWLFLLIYDPRLQVFPSSWLKLLVLVISPVFFLKRNRFAKTLLRKDILFLIFYPIFIFDFVGMASSINMACDYSLAFVFFIPPLLFALITWGWSQLIIEKLGVTFEGFLSSIVDVVAIQSLFVVLEVFSSPFKNFLFAVLYKGGNNSWDFATAFRPTGVSVFAGDGLGIIQAMGGACTLFLLWKNYQKIWTFIRLFLIGFSCLLIARSSFVLLLLFSFLTFLLFPGRKKFVKKLLSALLIGLFCFAIAWFLAIPKAMRDRFEEKIIPWAFSIFYHYAETGSFASKDVDAQFKMIFLPEDELEVWFGNGSYTNSNTGLNAIPSDNGYIRTIFATGSLGLFLIFSYYFFWLLLWIKYSPDRAISLFSIGVWLTLFVSHLKVPTLYYGSTQILIWSIFWGLLSAKLKFCNFIGLEKVGLANQEHFLREKAFSNG